MSFESILQEVVDECRGALAVALMGSDGIPIAEAQGVAVETTADIATAGVEFARILSEIDKAADALNAGGLNELLVGLDRFSLLFRRVDDDVMLVLALAPDGNIGKARYLMRRHLLAIKQEL